MGSYFSVQYMLDSLPALASYLPVTVFITLVSGVIGTFLGMLLAVVRVRKVPVLNQLTRIFISFIRSTPFLVQLFVVYFGVPELLQKLGVDVDSLPPMLFILVIFVLHVGAYGAEILRASIQSVAPGEKEAAASLGMTTCQIYRRVILPQAFVLSIPPLLNEIISTLKSTALIFNVGIVDMMRQADLMGGNSQRYLELYVDAAILYGVLIFAMTVAGRLTEKHFNVEERARKVQVRSVAING
ncbi:MAG: amino acid ABC transporter permease [Acidaminococcus sp.]|uniref:amino acid ABC transporter permease n=1 Tax=Acidaminococcus sp. TaxID=1872103 RepID=UPI003F1397FA